MDENQTEKRRRELLSQTRQLSSPKESLPAVHPRYRNAYKSLYEEGETETDRSSLGIRIVISCLLFIGFVLMDEQEYSLASVNSQMIVNSLEEGMDVQETFQEIYTFLQSEIQ